MIRYFSYFISIFFSVLQFSQSQSYDIAPKIHYAVSSISINDFRDNPSKSYYSERNYIATSYIPSSFGLSELNQNSIAFSYHDSNFVHLVNLTGSFGNLFTLSNVGYSFGYNMFENFIPSLTINYSYLKIQNYNEYGHLTLDFSGVLKLDSNLKFGFSITNLLNSTLESNNNFTRQNALFGFEYKVTNDLSVHLGSEIRIENSTGIILGFINEFEDLGKIGISYSTEPEMIELNLLIDTFSDLFIIYNMNYHNYLGTTHQFGLGYQFE